MGCKVRGSEEIQAQLRAVPEKVKANLPSLLQEYANNIAQIAKHNHNFTSDNYDLENSVTPYADPTKNYMVVYLNNERTTVQSKGEDFDYGLYIHKGAKDKKRWKGDPFVFRAFEQKQEALNKAVEGLIWDILTQS